MNYGEEKIVFVFVVFVVSIFDFNIDCCFFFNFFISFEMMDGLFICIFVMNNI